MQWAECRQEDSVFLPAEGDSRDEDIRVEKDPQGDRLRRAAFRARRSASRVIPLRFASVWKRLESSRKRVSARRSTTKSPTSSARRYVSFEIPRSFRIRAGNVSCPFVVTLTISAMDIVRNSYYFKSPRRWENLRRSVMTRSSRLRSVRFVRPANETGAE